MEGHDTDCHQNALRSTLSRPGYAVVKVALAALETGHSSLDFYVLCGRRL